MQRNPSDSSTASTSRLRRFGSAFRSLRSVKHDRDPLSPSSDVAHSDAPPKQKFVQELPATELQSPSSVAPTSTVERLIIQELEQTVQELSVSGSGRMHFDSEYKACTAYFRVRDRLCELCKRLVLCVQQSHDNVLHSTMGIQQSRPTSPAWYGDLVNDPRLTAINAFRTYLESLVGALRRSLSAACRVSKPDATPEQIDLLFIDKAFRISTLGWMGNSRGDAARPPYWELVLEHLEQWEQFDDFDRVNSDLAVVERRTAAIRSYVDWSWNVDSELIGEYASNARYAKNDEVAIREIDVAPRGDSILSFSNGTSKPRHILRFRVSSHMLMEVSSYFAQVFSSSYEDSGVPELQVLTIPHCERAVCKDGSVVKVYNMPQAEDDKAGSLTTLLHAAHMHNDKIPRQVSYDEFIGIAEVCLRYQCTSPLEMAVEHRWLPQWLHKANDDSPDGMILISYVFGLRQIFRRTTKSAILNISHNDNFLVNQIVPPEVRAKIEAMRVTKLAQIHAACAEAIKEYYREPSEPPKLDDTRFTWELASKTKCPKGSQQCDATNLGWLLLVFSEMGILPNVMSTMFGQPHTAPPRPSIQTLLDRLRRIPSAPQTHNAVCDQVAAFVRSMNDIFNSISGVTFWDVCGKGGWALSRDHDTTTGFTNDLGMEIFEMPVPVTSKPAAKGVALRNEGILLRIMSQLDNPEDRHAVALINKDVYNTYKKHELALKKASIRPSDKYMPSIFKDAESISTVRSEPLRHSTLVHPLSAATNHLTSPYDGNQSPEGRTSPFEISDDDMSGSCTPHSPSISLRDVLLSSDEINSILWPHSSALDDGERGDSADFESDRNAKYLLGDGTDLYKSLVVEGKKHLQNESDEQLRRRLHASRSGD
ncbi:MAG: hypothetical protein M1818_007711 [Claussenomyces sp. TS43310]|nr:MAG: hypothetical protein M1818_007711 [Claussenomyces sp. TS43310]